MEEGLKLGPPLLRRASMMTALRLTGLGGPPSRQGHAVAGKKKKQRIIKQPGTASWMSRGGCGRCVKKLSNKSPGMFCMRSELVSPLRSHRALAPQGLTEQGSAVQPVYGSPSYPAGQEQTCIEVDFKFCTSVKLSILPLYCQLTYSQRWCRRERGSTGHQGRRDLLGSGVLDGLVVGLVVAGRSH